MSTDPQRTCPSCGHEFSGAMEFCPVCMLRKALADGVDSGDSSSEDLLRPTSQDPGNRSNWVAVRWGSLILFRPQSTRCLQLWHRKRCAPNRDKRLQKPGKA